MKFNSWMIDHIEDDKGYLKLTFSRTELAASLEALTKQVAETPEAQEVITMGLELPDFYNVFQVKKIEIPTVERSDS